MGCCSNGNGCCKNKRSQISKEEYEDLKEYLREEIINYRSVDYMNDNSEHQVCVEVEFEEYVLELEGIDKNNVNLDNIIDVIISNYMK